MFFKKSPKKEEYFVFNLGCAKPTQCVSFSVEKGIINADWYDEDEHCVIKDAPINEGFWDVLYSTALESGVLNWKAHKICNHFATCINIEVFNAEGRFPDGSAFEANNMHGMPEGFDEAIEAIKAVFRNCL